MKTTRLLTAAALVAGSLGAATSVSADGDHPRLDPDLVEAVIFPGQSIDVDKTVHTPELPPVLDVCLLIDLSGTYFDDLPNIDALAPGIWDSLEAGGVDDLQAGVATFIDFPYQPWGSASSGDYAYRLDQQLTSDKATWTGAISAIAAAGTRNGSDLPESQYEALYQAVTGAGNDVAAAPDDAGDIAAGQQCDFRENATKVIMLTTDDTFHNAGDAGPFPYPGASAADTTAALVDAGVKVIGLKAPGAAGELDALAAATGGAVVPTAADSSDIAAAILAALDEIELEVTMASNCASVTGGVIDTTFAPDSVTVENGGDASFVETISVAADAPGGVYECLDAAFIDGALMVDADGNPIYERKVITVPENFVTGGGHITLGKGKNKIRVLNHGGNAGYLDDGSLVGHWNFNFHEFGANVQTTEITSLQFVDTGLDPAPPEADADTAVMTADVRVNLGDGWVDGCQMTVTFTDGGEPEQDAISDLFVACPNGGAGFGYNDLTGGNIQMHEGTKG